MSHNVNPTVTDTTHRSKQSSDKPGPRPEALTRSSGVFLGVTLIAAGLLGVLGFLRWNQLASTNSSSVLTVVPCKLEPQAAQPSAPTPAILPPLEGADQISSSPSSPPRLLKIRPLGLGRTLSKMESETVMACIERGSREHIRESPFLRIDRGVLVLGPNEKPIAYIGTFVGTTIMFVRTSVIRHGEHNCLDQDKNEDLFISHDFKLWKLIFD